MNSYHPSEAQVLGTLEKTGMVQSEWFLALRTILTKPLSYFLQNRKELLSRFDSKFGVELNESEIFSSSDFYTLFSQVSIP